MMWGRLAALLLVGLEPAGRAFAADCDRSLSACSALLQQQDAAAANQTQLAGVDQPSAYAGAVSYLERLVTSSSFTQLVNRVATIDKVIGGDRRMVDELKQDRARLQGL